MSNLQQLLEQKANIEAAIKQERDRLAVDNDRRLEAWRAQREAANSAGIAEARRTGRNHVFMDDGTEVTATPSGSVFYNMADWY